MAQLARGTVTDRPWGQTLWALGMRGLTGQVTVHSDGKQYLIAFDRGAIVAAFSPLASDSAVRVALTAGLVSSTQVPEITRRLATTAGRDELDVLAEAARLAPDHVQRLRRRLVAQRAARTFSLERGDFSVDDSITLPVIPGSELDVRTIIYMGARSSLSEDRMRGDLGHFGAWFQIKPEALEDLPQFGFSETEKPVIQLLLAGANVTDLDLAQPELDGRGVRAVVYALAACGACEARAEPQPPAVAHLDADTLNPPTIRAPARTQTPPAQSRTATGGVPVVTRTSTGSVPVQARTSTGSVPVQARNWPASGPVQARTSTGSGPVVARTSTGSVRSSSVPAAEQPRPNSASVSPPVAPSVPSNTSASPPISPRPPSPSVASPPPERATSPRPLAPGARAASPLPTRARRNTLATEEVETLIAQKLPLLDRADHFTLLGVEQTSSIDDIRKAYFVLARKLHPDRLASLGVADDKRSGQRLFAQINAAFAVLNDAVSREEYLSVLRRGGASAVQAEESRADELAQEVMFAEEAFKRGEMALRREQLELALSELTLAVELQPKEAEYQALLAWTKFALAPDKNAVAAATRKDLQKAADTDAENPTPRFYLGRVERMLGREREALQHFQAVLSIKPGHSAAASEARVLEQRLRGKK